MSDVIIKEALDWIAFNDQMHRTSRESMLKKLEALYPELYQEWLVENEELIRKWAIPA